MLDFLPALLALSSTVLMMTVVVCAALCAVLIALNLSSLKRRSASQVCVTAVTILVLGCMLAIVTVGIRTTGKAVPVLSTRMGQVAGGLIALSALTACVGLVQLGLSSRFRRGKKRAISTIFFALLAAGLLYQRDQATRHPKAREEVISTTQPIALDLHAPVATPKPPPAANPPPLRAGAPPAPASTVSPD